MGISLPKMDSRETTQTIRTIDLVLIYIDDDSTHDTRREKHHYSQWC